MTLLQLIKRQVIGQTVNYTNTEAIYLKRPFSNQSEVRFGQKQFVAGGIINGKTFFCTNEELTDAISRYLDGVEPEEWMTSEITDYVLEQLDYKGDTEKE